MIEAPVAPQPSLWHEVERSSLAQAMYPFAVLMVLAWPIGVPLTITFLLWRNRGKLIEARRREKVPDSMRHASTKTHAHMPMYHACPYACARSWARSSMTTRRGPSTSPTSSPREARSTRCAREHARSPAPASMTLLTLLCSALLSSAQLRSAPLSSAQLRSALLSSAQLCWHILHHP